jgi:hypothetical protein
VTLQGKLLGTEPLKRVLQPPSGAGGGANSKPYSCDARGVDRQGIVYFADVVD